MKPDPFLSYFGHPALPCGYNSDPNDGDEIDGSGTNWEIWPALFDTFTALEVIILTDEMMGAFDDCADYAPPCENNTFIVPLTVREVVIT